MALVRYTYQPNQETAPFETWLVYVFQLQEGSWRIVHDQNTALDFLLSPAPPDWRSSRLKTDEPHPSYPNTA